MEKYKLYKGIWGHFRSWN